MKIKQMILAAAILMGISGFFLSPIVSAADTYCGTTKLQTGQSCCGGAVTSVISCDQTGGKNSTLSQTGIWGILLIVINILTAGVGIAAVGGILYGSIMYASAGASADQTKKAKAIIANVVIGLIAYALMCSFLNFIIPGGLFS